MRPDTYHRLFGLHSNIPFCCVEAYVQDVDNMPPPGRKGVPRGYRPCWDCYNSNREINIHRCTVECIPFLESIDINPRAIQDLKRKATNVKLDGSITI